jgi:hypothetical protein
VHEKQEVPGCVHAQEEGRLETQPCKSRKVEAAPGSSCSLHDEEKVQSQILCKEACCSQGQVR